MDSLPKFFSSPTTFRKWLEENHQKAKELLVGFYKIKSQKPSMTWSESVDEALCFGWIDGVRRSIDAESYSIRFTPRKPNSTWSFINIKKMEDLTKKELVHPAGMAVFEKRTESNSKIYSYENKPILLDKAFEETFKANAIAWADFQKRPQSYQKTALHFVMTAKQDATRLKRLNELIEACEAGKKIKSLNY
jgi:uncharacterized protein YdeI (YjbR/CyaY-like superfamily)